MRATRRYALATVLAAGALGLLLVVSVESALAQSTDANPDSLVASFLRHGIRSSWQPHEIFRNCPELTASDSAAFDGLIGADLDPWQVSDLARSWHLALRQCHDSRLENWYFDQIMADIRNPQPSRVALWSALKSSNSPRVSTFLRDLLWDSSVPGEMRDEAGAQLFTRYEGQARVTEYLRAFEGYVMSPFLGGFQTEKAMEIDAHRVVREVLLLLKRQPSLANQGAFETLIRQSVRSLNSEERIQFADELATLAEQVPSDSFTHDRLRASADWLRRESRT